VMPYFSILVLSTLHLVIFTHLHPTHAKSNLEIHAKSNLEIHAKSNLSAINSALHFLHIDQLDFY
jgi:hypothetical protein